MTIDDPAATDPLTVGGRAFSSRLFLGTGKFPSNESLAGAIAASGTELVTVALRRVFPPVGQARGHPRPPLPPARPGGDAGGGRDPVRGGLRRPPLRPRRPR